MITDYQQQAADFAKKHNVKLEILSSDYKKHFADDTEPRYVFKCRLSRNGKSYTFDFGQSYADGSKEPTMYDILTCLEKYEVGSFDDFCSEYGYFPINSSEDFKKAQKIHKAVKREAAAVNRLFADIMEELQEIQ